MNFGETHNDHLQVAAETGLPGYVLLAGAMALLAIPARRRRDNVLPLTTEQTVGRAIRMPLAATFFVVAHCAVSAADRGAAPDVPHSRRDRHLLGSAQ